jgi:hypothetical protein
MNIEARLFGCASMSFNPEEARSLRDRYAPRSPDWRIASFPGGFIAANSAGVLFENDGVTTGIAGWRAGAGDDGTSAGLRFPEAAWEGQYCAAQYDAARKSLCLVVDTFGVERLFYFERQGVFCFSDDLAALWRWFGAARKPCAQSIDAYFTLFQIPAPLTGFAGIRQVAPNSAVIVQNGKTEVREAVWKPESAERNYAEALQELEAELGAVAAPAVDPAQPAAILFSGGVDSTLLAALLSRGGLNLEAHSFGEAGSEELAIAAERAAWLNMPLQRWVMPSRLSPDEVVLKWRMPVFSMRVAYVDWFCGQVGATRRRLISGSGADGLFSHNRTGRETGDGGAMPRLYGGARRFAHRFLFADRFRKLVRGNQPEEILARTHERQGPLFQYLAAAKPSIVDAYARAVPSGVVTLFPFLSRRVVELALRLGSDAPKAALKTLLARCLPAFPVNETKRGFGYSVRLGTMFSDCAGASGWASRVTRGPLCQEDILDARAVHILFEESASDPRLRNWAWGVGALDAWFRLVVA